MTDIKRFRVSGKSLTEKAPGKRKWQERWRGGGISSNLPVRQKDQVVVFRPQSRRLGEPLLHLQLRRVVAPAVDAKPAAPLFARVVLADQGNVPRMPVVAGTDRPALVPVP